MATYRRAYIEGGTYFFTLVTFNRQPILCDLPVRNALRESINVVRRTHPFKIEAWVLLPDHLHCIWTLPKGDPNYSMRWNQIKRNVSLRCSESYNNNKWKTPIKKKRRESTIWQRRFWEHQVRDEADFHHHLDYIHYNPVKHGLCKRPIDWPYSTLRKLTSIGLYTDGWANDSLIDIQGDFGE